MKKDTVDYYDKESSSYATKRYPEVSKTYFQYLFKKRLEIFVNMLEEVVDQSPSNLSILEIGSADGVLFRNIECKFPGRFTRLVGVDISSKMVEEARKQNRNPRASFFLREDLKEDKFDVIIELGVHPFNLENELSYVFDHLNPEGHFFYSVAGSHSLYAKLKLKNIYYVKDYKKYEKYEEAFDSRFLIEKSKVYGLFVPKLWAFPFMARFLQPLVESLFQYLTYNLFHEKIYLLRSKIK